jgi:hypothetical protein
MKYSANEKGKTFDKAVRTTVFVDYESWVYGCRNQHQTDPEVADWFDHVKQRGQIDDVFFFADFSQESIKDHTEKIRRITSYTIDCSKSDKSKGKDYTDFIMLDHIYQHLIKRQETEQYIIFTGDGHFQSIVAFLRNFNRKKVGIYAVDGSINSNLVEAADWYVRVIPSSGRNDAIKRAIINNLDWVKKKEEIIPTYKKTVSIVARNNPEYTEQDISAVLSSMITRGEIKQEDAVIPFSGYAVKRLIYAESEESTE